MYKSLVLEVIKSHFMKLPFDSNHTYTDSTLSTNSWYTDRYERTNFAPLLYFCTRIIQKLPKEGIHLIQFNFQKHNRCPIIE